MYLTKGRLNSDIYLLKLKINNLNCKISNLKLAIKYESKFFSNIFSWFLTRYLRKYKYLKLRLYLLEVLKSFPIASQNILLRDYKDTTKLHLMLYQNESINKFKIMQKEIADFNSHLSNVKIKINK